MGTLQHATKLVFAHLGMCHQSAIDGSALFMEFPALIDDWPPCFQNPSCHARRSERLYTGTLYLFFFFFFLQRYQNKTTTVVLFIVSHTYGPESHLLSHIQKLYNFIYTSEHRTYCDEPLLVCWPSCMRKQCDEHLSLRWPVLLVWSVLSSSLLFSTYTD